MLLILGWPLLHGKDQAKAHYKGKARPPFQKCLLFYLFIFVFYCVMLLDVMRQILLVFESSLTNVTVESFAVTVTFFVTLSKFDRVQHDAATGTPTKFLEQHIFWIWLQFYGKSHNLPVPIIGWNIKGLQIRICSRLH